MTERLDALVALGTGAAQGRGIVLCPLCGCPLPSTAKFCRECAASLNGGRQAPMARSTLAAAAFTDRPLANGKTKVTLPGNFWRQLTASGISALGDGITQSALPVLAVSLTADTRLIAGVSFALFLPWFLFALPAGVVVDRYNRQRIMVITNLIRAALLGAIALTAATGTLNIWILMAILFVVGTAEVFFDSSAQAILPALVNNEQLPRANGLLATTESLFMQFIGQPIGALLIALLIGLPFGIDAASFAVAAALVASLTVSFPAHSSNGASDASYRATIADGLRRIWSHQVLRSLWLLLGLVNFASLFGFSILVKFSLDELHVSKRWYGAFLGLMALGAVIGGLLGDRVMGRFGRSKALLLSYFLMGLTPLAMGLSPNPYVFAAFSALEAFGIAIWNVASRSMRQQMIPTQLFGRVNGAYRWLGSGAMAFGALVGGQLGHIFNLRAPYIVGGIAILLGWIYARLTLTDAKILVGEQYDWGQVTNAELG